MRFVLSTEQREFARSLRNLLAASDPPAVARAWGAGDYTPGRMLWQRLAAMGVAELGAHPVELVVAFEELGRAIVPGPYVESVAVLPVLLPGADPTVMATLAAPPSVPYACDAAAAASVYLLDGTTLHAATVVEEVASVDAARRLARVTATHEVGRDLDICSATDLAALATAAQIVGAGYALLHRSTDYARTRRQFGEPIGRFQAIKHQLADAYVALELARPLLFGAALTLGTGTAGRDASAAKVAGTDAAYRAARVALQVHGAIGYTAEYDLSLWLTKVRALTSAWGTRRDHRDRVLAAIRS